MLAVLLLQAHRLLHTPGRGHCSQKPVQRQRGRCGSAPYYAPVMTEDSTFSSSQVERSIRLCPVISCPMSYSRYVTARHKGRKAATDWRARPTSMSSSREPCWTMMG